MSPAWPLYRAIASVAGTLAPLAAPFLPAAERERFDERLGRVPPRADGVSAWVHAASLGEATAVAPLLTALRETAPAATFHLTATTRAGRARLAALDPASTFAPLDAGGPVGEFLVRVRPRRLLLIETELWPRTLLALERAGVRAAVVSARLSERSVRGYRAAGGGFRERIRRLAAVLCQSAVDAERWRSLGADPARVAVTGNLKDSALPAPGRPDRSAARRALGFEPDRPLLVLASLRPGEGAIVARAWRELPQAVRAAWQVAALPRHLDTAEALAGEIAAAGVSLGEGPDAWRWVPRHGVLMEHYRAADAAVVGGSLVAAGGHNPLEPAAFGAAIVMGPHHASQHDGVAALSERGGIAVAPADALGATLGALLSDPARRAAMGDGAMAVAASRRDAAARTRDRLVAWDVWPA